MNPKLARAFFSWVVRALRFSPILLIEVVTACNSSLRNKGDITLYTVDPTFRFPAGEPFLLSEIREPEMKGLLKAEATLLDTKVLRALGRTKEDVASATREELARALTALLQDNTLHETFSKDDNREPPTQPPGQANPPSPGVSRKVPKPYLSKEFQDLLAKQPTEGPDLRRLNRTLIRSGYSKALTPQPTFTGGFLTGAFSLVRNTDFLEANALRLKEAYRVSFDAIHVRYTQKPGGSNFIVYVEMYRGSKLKPFYCQVIAHETDMPRDTNMIRKTVMTPSFTYQEDEPILIKIVGIDLASNEVRGASETFRGAAETAQKLSSVVPYASFVPLLTDMAGSLFDLAMNQNHIEFQYAIAFYPYENRQIAVPLPHFKKEEKYYAVLPLAASQFVLIKDEDRRRQVGFQTWFEYVHRPISRAIPLAAWLVTWAGVQPVFELTTEKTLQDYWPAPSLWEEAVDRDSVSPIEDYKKLAVFNHELRLAEKRPDDMEVFSEPNRSKVYTDKTYVIFSILKTEKGVREIGAEDLQEQLKALATAGVTDGTEDPKVFAEKLTAIGKKLVSFDAFGKLEEKSKKYDKNDTKRVEILLEPFQKEDLEDYLGTLLAAEMNRLVYPRQETKDYARLAKDWKDTKKFPLEWDAASNRWVIKQGSTDGQGKKEEPPKKEEPSKKEEPKKEPPK